MYCVGALYSTQLCSGRALGKWPPDAQICFEVVPLSDFFWLPWLIVMVHGWRHSFTAQQAAKPLTEEKVYVPTLLVSDS